MDNDTVKGVVIQSLALLNVKDDIDFSKTLDQYILNEYDEQLFLNHIQSELSLCDFVIMDYEVISLNELINFLSSLNQDLKQDKLF